VPESIADIHYHNQIFVLTGSLDYSNADLIYEKSLDNLNVASHLVFDFAQIKSINSSGIALMIEWLKFAKQHKKKIQFQNIPSYLLTIAKAAGIDKLISGQDEFH